jgi:type I restriction enzyme M protein
VANRVHRLFAQACQDDPSVFPETTRIALPDKKIFDVVAALQDISLMTADVDSIGSAFESFFGSIFRGELGQYFTMRQLARFTVSLLNIAHDDYVIDPTAGSGGFLLETLLQVWHGIDASFSGQPAEQILRIRTDFALLRVYGIEIHDILSRVCKINLLLHHDGHTNIEGDRSCLDSTFTKPRLQDWHGQFSRVVGNPPFGDDVEEGDDDLLGTNRLENFEVAAGRDKVPSEHAIVERSVDFLQPNGRFGLIIPDGLLNNQGEQSNCPRVRSFLATRGQLEAIVSLPDFAFRKSGAQNKTSILFFRKFSREEKLAFDRAFEEVSEDFERASAEATERDEPAQEWNEESIIDHVYERPPFCGHYTFMAEANHIGYTPAGVATSRNDLFVGAAAGRLADDQGGSILGEWRRFTAAPSEYRGRQSPDCMALPFSKVWQAHSSHRIDPKYHLFKRDERSYTPEGWVRVSIAEAMNRREDGIDPSEHPSDEFVVMTISQTGDIRPREAGKGRNPPEWLGMYFGDSSSKWFRAKAGDVVFSSIDLWKGCIAVVPDEFDDAIVTKEFPIYQVTDGRLDAEFLSYLLRCRYYQRAFRAITTGHSNRRRTQPADFEALEICFPPDKQTQKDLIQDFRAARRNQQQAAIEVRNELLSLSDVVDGRHDEDLPEIDAGALVDPEV